jgi:hypothetical protein
MSTTWDGKFYTKGDIISYFKSFKRVRSVEVKELPEAPYIIHVYVKSWFPLNELRILNDIVLAKAITTTVFVHNQYFLLEKMIKIY